MTDIDIPIRIWISKLATRELVLMATLDINAKTVLQNPEDNASKKKMVYTSDAGTGYVVMMDENIGETMGFLDFTDTATEKEKPASLRMRTVSFSDASGKVKGQYPVGTPTTPIYVEGGTIKLPRKGSILGVVCTVLGAQGEKRTLLSAADTGQQDGDNT